MSRPPVARSLALEILKLRVHVGCADRAAATALRANFEAMLAPAPDATCDLRYRVERDRARALYTLARDGAPPLEPCADLGDLLFALEKDLTIELQRRRRDLLFLHAAVLEWRERAIVLAGASGHGKSTTAWALLHRGFRFLSDELGPVDLDAMSVHPFPHALCLKREPPPPYRLPAEAAGRGLRIHVPPRALPSPVVAGPRPLAAVFFVAYRAELEAPRLRAVSPGEASARLYACTLNALAHANEGLDAVVRIAESVPCFALEAAELARTAALIGDATAEALAAPLRR